MDNHLRGRGTDPERFDEPNEDLDEEMAEGEAETEKQLEKMFGQEVEPDGVVSNKDVTVEPDSDDDSELPIKDYRLNDFHMFVTRNYPLKCFLPRGSLKDDVLHVQKILSGTGPMSYTGLRWKEDPLKKQKKNKEGD